MLAGDEAVGFLIEKGGFFPQGKGTGPQSLGFTKQKNGGPPGGAGGRAPKKKLVKCSGLWLGNKNKKNSHG